MTVLRSVASLGSLVFGVLVACSDDNAGTGPQPECPSQVTLSISAGTTPTFAWAPACRGFFLLVEENATDMWSVMTPGSNDLAPPITYGVVPPGATELESPAPLLAGVAYEVILFRHTGPGDDDGELIAIQQFTP